MRQRGETADLDSARVRGDKIPSEHPPRYLALLVHFALLRRPDIGAVTAAQTADRCASAQAMNTRSSTSPLPGVRLNKVEPGLQDRRLTPARSVARLLDTAFRVPGTRFRFGLDPVLGLVPGFGELVGGTFSAYLVWVAFRLGAPGSVMLRMAMNVGLDALFGAVPFLGDIFDATFKANVRNMALIERYAVEPEEVKSSSKIVLVVAVFLIAAMIFASIWIAVSVLSWLLGAL